jgi:hypothetical protein
MFRNFNFIKMTAALLMTIFVMAAIATDPPAESEQPKKVSLPEVKDAMSDVRIQDYAQLVAVDDGKNPAHYFNNLTQLCVITQVGVLSGSHSAQGCFSNTSSLAGYKSCCHKHYERVKSEAGLALEIIKGTLTPAISARIKATLEAKWKVERGGAPDGDKAIIPVTDEAISAFFDKVKEKMTTNKFPGDKKNRSYEDYYTQLLSTDLPDNRKKMEEAMLYLENKSKFVIEKCNQAKKEAVEKQKGKFCIDPKVAAQEIAEKRTYLLDIAFADLDEGNPGNLSSKEEILNQMLDRYYMCAINKIKTGVCANYKELDKFADESRINSLREMGMCEFPGQDTLICPADVKPNDKDPNVVALPGDNVPGGGGGEAGRGKQEGQGKGDEGQGQGGGGNDEQHQGPGEGKGKGSGKGDGQGARGSQGGGDKSKREVSCAMTEDDAKKWKSKGIDKSVCDPKRMCARSKAVAEKYKIKMCEASDRICVFKRSDKDPLDIPICTGASGESDKATQAGVPGGAADGNFDRDQEGNGEKGEGKGNGDKGDGKGKSKEKSKVKCDKTKSTCQGSSEGGATGVSDGVRNGIGDCPDWLKEKGLCFGLSLPDSLSGILSDYTDPCARDYHAVANCKSCVTPDIPNEKEFEDVGHMVKQGENIKQVSRFLMRNLMMTARDQMKTIRFQKGTFDSVEDARADNMEHYLSILDGACVDNSELKQEAELMLAPLRQETRTTNYFQDESRKTLKKAASDLGPLKEIIKQLAETAADFPEEFVNFESMFLDLAPCGTVIKGAINLVRNEMLQYKDRQKECTEFPKLMKPNETERLTCEGIANRVNDLASGKWVEYGSPKLESGVNIDGSELEFHEETERVNRYHEEFERYSGEVEGLKEGLPTLEGLQTSLTQAASSYSAMGDRVLPKGHIMQEYSYNADSGKITNQGKNTDKGYNAKTLAQYYSGQAAAVGAQIADIKTQIKTKEGLAQAAKERRHDHRASMKKITDKYTKVKPGITYNGRELVPPTVVSPKEPKVLQCHRKCQRMHALMHQKAKILNENPDLSRRLEKDKSAWDHLAGFFASVPAKPDEDKLFTHINTKDAAESERLLDKALSQTDADIGRKKGDVSLENKSHTVMHDIRNQIRSLCKDPEKFVKAALTNSKMKGMLSNCELQKQGMPSFVHNNHDIWADYNKSWGKNCAAAASDADLQYYVCRKVDSSGSAEKAQQGLGTALQVGGDAADVAGCVLIVAKGVAIGAKVARVGISVATRASAKVGVRTAIALGLRQGARAALRAPAFAGLDAVNGIVGKVGLVNMGVALASATEQHFGLLNPDRHNYCNQIAKTGISQGHYDLVSQEDQEQCKAHAEGLVQFARMAILGYAVGKFDDAAQSALAKIAGPGAHRAHYERMLLDRYEKLSTQERSHIEGLDTHQKAEMHQQLMLQLAGEPGLSLAKLKGKNLSDLIDLYNERQGAKVANQKAPDVTSQMSANDRLMGQSSPLTKAMRDSMNATELLHLEKIESENYRAYGDISRQIAELEKIPENKRSASQNNFLKILKENKELLKTRRKEYYDNLAKKKKGCT